MAERRTCGDRSVTATGGLLVARLKKRDCEIVNGRNYSKKKKKDEETTAVTALQSALIIRTIEKRKNEQRDKH